MPLTELGEEEAAKAGEIMMEMDMSFDIVYTSWLKRALKTTWVVLDTMDLCWIDVVKTWRLNERMYGDLIGRNKKEAVELFGADNIAKWRRSYDIPPPPISKYDIQYQGSQINSTFRDRELYPGHEERYQEYLKEEDIPQTECLKDVLHRTAPFWEEEIVPTIRAGKSVLLSGHANCIRALLRYIDNITDDEIMSVNVPRAIPLVYEFDENMKVLKCENAAEPLSGYYAAPPDVLEALFEFERNQVKV